MRSVVVQLVFVVRKYENIFQPEGSVKNKYAIRLAVGNGRVK